MFDLSTEEAQLLLETGLMAIGQNRFKSAMKILVALEQYRPGHESLDVAKVILCLSQFQGKIALEFLDNEALPRHPDSRMTVITASPSFERLFGQRARKKNRFYNGRLECECLTM